MSYSCLIAVPERHLQLQSLSVFTIDDDDFDWLPQLTNLTSLSLQSIESFHWEKLFSAIIHLLKLKHLKLNIYGGKYTSDTCSFFNWAYRP